MAEEYNEGIIYQHGTNFQGFFATECKVKEEVNEQKYTNLLIC